MIREAIDRIIELSRPEIIEVGDCSYSSKKIYPVKEECPAALVLNTLTGLVDYISENRDELEHGKLLIHVESPTKVRLLSALQGCFNQRFVYVESIYTQSVFPFGRWMDTTEFVTALQIYFEKNEDLEKILKVVGNITEEVVRTVQDDGVTQRVIAKAGIARKEEVSVPNPVRLIPYRTFREIEQPVGDFVLRVMSGQEGELPRCSLHESDGGMWELEAIEKIADYLKNEITEDISVIA